MLGIVIASAIFVSACYILYITKVPVSKTLPQQLLTEPINGNEYHRKSILKDDGIPVITTLYEAFKRGLAIDPDAPFLGFRQLDLSGAPYEWFTYKQVR